MRRPRSVFRFVRIRSNHARMFVPGVKRPPAPERPRVRLLHQFLGLLSRADESARHAVDLVCELERLLLEVDAITSLACDAPAGLAFGIGCLGLAHRATLAIGSSRPETPSGPRLFPDRGSGDLAKAAACERRNERIATRHLVVPAENDATHQVRVGRLQTLVAAQRARQPADAALAAYAADLDRLGDGRHLPGC